MRKTIFSTDYSNYRYEDYLEYCELDGCEAGTEDSMDYYNWVSDMIDFDINDTFADFNIKQDANTTVIITGTLGLWNGRPDIEPVFVESDRIYNYSTGKNTYNSALTLAIKKCMDGMNDIDCYLDDETGYIEVIGHHHDGSNHFYIWKLSEFGKNTKANSEDDDYVVTKEWFEPFKEEELF